MREAACWAHGRRNFFKLAMEKAPLAIEAVKRIDAILAIEREINGLSTEARLAARARRALTPAGWRSGELAAGAAWQAVIQGGSDQGDRLPRPAGRRSPASSRMAACA
jgi:hypothetical protein